MKKLYLLSFLVCICFANAFAEDIKVTYTDAQGTWEFTILTQWNEEASKNVPYAARLDKVTDYTYDDITVPSVAKYEDVDYPVEQIGERVFQNNRTLSNVVLPTTINSIGRDAFNGCSSLKEVKNTSNCGYIGPYSFSGCSRLTSIDLSLCERIDYEAFHGCSGLTMVNLSSCKRLDGYAFDQCASLQSVVSLSKIEYVGEYCFWNCGSLKEVDLSAGVEIKEYAFDECKSLVTIGSLENSKIGSWAFRYCEALKSVDVSKAASIGEWAFEQCSSLESVGDLSAFTSLENHTFVRCSSLKEVNLYSCKVIGSNAFESCSSLEKVTLGSCTTIESEAFRGCAIKKIDLSTVKLLGGSAFKDCKNLEIDSIPNLKIVEGETFSGCTSLKSIDLSKISTIGNNAFKFCSNLKTVDGFGHITEVAEGLFWGCKSLETIDLSKCENVGRFAFQNCITLKSVNMPLLTSIPDAYSGEHGYWYDENGKYQTRKRGVFDGCASLKEVSIPSCTTIGSMAFYNCSELETVDTLKACETIGNTAFQNCGKLRTINLSKVFNIGSDAFNGCTSLNTIDLTACQTLGSNAFSGCSSITKIDGFGHFTEVPDGMFKGMTMLESIDLSKIESIGNNSFEGCSSLTTVDLSACKMLGANVFSGCSSLKTIKGFTNITEIPDGLFNGLEALETIDLSKIEKIGNNALKNCTGLTTLNLASCKSVGSEAFMGCKRLKNLEFPVCESLGRSAFMNCDSLATVSFPILTSLPDGYYENNWTWSDEYYRGLFLGCKLLKEVSIPSCKKIGDKLFRNCSKLTSVGTLTSCESVGVSAFEGCDSLKVISLPVAKNIGSSAFSGCSSLDSISLPATDSIANNAFISCKSLGSISLPVVKAIGSSAFSGCGSLISLSLPATDSIASSAFWGCSTLSSISLPVVRTIGESAFSGCIKLGDFILESTKLKYIGSNAFTHTGNITFMSTTPATINSNTFGEYILCLVPADALETYQAADNWYDIRNRIFTIGDKFNYDIAVTAQENGSGIYTALGEDDLRKAVSLKLTGTINSYDIMIMRDKMPNLHYLDMSESSVTASSYEYYTGYSTRNDTIGTNSFSGLGKLVSVKLPKTIKYIAGRAFSDCANLQSVEMYEGLEAIGSSAFQGCRNLREAVLPKGLNRIESDAFQDCSALQKIVLPEGLTSIYGWAFYGCSSLKEVIFPTTLETIGSRSFTGCHSLPGIKLPNRLKTIEGSAFENCSNLRELNIPSSVQEIQNGAFSGCGIRKVYTYTVLPTKINQGTFSNYENAVLYIPDFSDSRNNYYWATGWSQFSKLLPFDKNVDYDYFYLNEDYTLDEDRIEGGPDADVNPGGGLIVEGDDTQNLNDVTISNNNNGIWGSIIGDSNISANLLKFEVQVQGNKWYFFSFPYDIKMSNIDCQSQFLFRYYDGEARATNGSGGWKDLIKGSDVLERGKGYIFQCSQNSILKITIETPTFDAEDFKQALSAYTADNAQDAGWNFVGNPYTSYFDLNDTKYAAPITVWNDQTKSYEALRPGDDDYQFHPFQAFFVQKPDDTGEINFDSDCRSTYTKSEEKLAASRARRLTRGVDTDRQLINLTIADTDVKDKCRVVFNENANVRYEVGCDAAKFISTEDVPQIYSVDYEGNKYAINERPSGEVNIAYQAKKAGYYKIGVTRMDRAIVLYDKETMAEFDFSTGDYSFETEAGTFENRFILKLANSSATGLADIKKETGVSAMGCDDGIYINNVGDAQVDIYSMSGVLLASHVGDGLVRLPKATYIIKVNNLSTKVLVK